MYIHGMKDLIHASKLMNSQNIMWMRPDIKDHILCDSIQYEISRKDKSIPVVRMRIDTDFNKHETKL